MGRLYYDTSRYYEELKKLPRPDGKRCVICGGKLPKYKRKYCSDKCFNTWYGILGIRDWGKVREMVLKRDDYVCQDCGIKQDFANPDACIEVHHVKPIEYGGDEFDPDNCVTLCHKCHVKRHKFLRTKSQLLTKFIGVCIFFMNWCKNSK